MKRAIPKPLLDRFLDAPLPDSLDRYWDIVLRDVEALLNTRAASLFGGDEGVLDYGLPDLTLSGATDSELLRLAWVVKTCLETYEPRLSLIQVEALPPVACETELLFVRVTASLKGFESYAPLSVEFPLSVSMAGNPVST